MSDVLIYQTEDDGEISIVDGLVELTDDFRSASYLSLFGGNEEDDGRDNNPLAWWGNLTDTDPAKQYRSETEFWLESLPVSSANLLKLEDAAKRDLQFFLNLGIVDALTVTVSLIELNVLEYIIDFGGGEQVKFIQNWKAQAQI